MSGVGKNTSHLLLPSILHLALLLKVFWGLSLYFALCVRYALILQDAVELPRLPCTTTEEGTPHICQDRSTSPPHCWSEEPGRLGAFKSCLPRVFLYPLRIQPRTDIQRHYAVLWCCLLWISVNNAGGQKVFSEFITFLHHTSINVCDFYAYLCIYRSLGVWIFAVWKKRPTCSWKNQVLRKQKWKDW